MLSEKCRVCLKGGKLMNIFEVRRSHMISAKLMSITKVQIHPDDELPKTICKTCVKKLDQCIKFVQLCEDSDSKLRASLSEVDRKSSDYLTIALAPKSDINLTQESLRDNNEPHKVTFNEIKEEMIENHIDTGNMKKSKQQQCPTCGKILSTKFRLQTHLRIHSGEHPFPCPHCQKSFRNKYNLVLHIRIHTGEKPFKCPDCNDTFRHPSSLAAHRRRHTGETPYHCKLCSRKFHTNSHLYYHLRIHTGEKNFECNICGKAFVARPHLRVHLLSHSGEKPHMCTICGLRLSRACHLKRHIRNIHNSQREQKERELEITHNPKRKQSQGSEAKKVASLASPIEVL